MTMAAVLGRETAHLPQRERDTIQRRLDDAITMVRNTRGATERALTDKLQSFGDCPRWVCELVSRRAFEVMRPAQAVAA